MAFGKWGKYFYVCVLKDNNLIFLDGSKKQKKEKDVLMCLLPPIGTPVWAQGKDGLLGKRLKFVSHSHKYVSMVVVLDLVELKYLTVTTSSDVIVIHSNECSIFEGFLLKMVLKKHVQSG
ncbi:hypothetical protein ACJMK2_007459 [Sinanodonta woodiana]|uniref:Uncharacterized protein n=1 Tax=Sinanodonta woodiana TaxID=1069815 RepID=A0ABD3VIM1_SINWO